MQRSLKKKAQSLPRLRKLEFEQIRDNLTKLFAKESVRQNSAQKNKQDFLQMGNVIDPEQSRKEKVSQILLKSKSMIQKNKDKIQVAKRFRILKKKSAGPFLTGVQIYKEQEQPQQPSISNQQLGTKNTDQQLRQLLSQKYDDLAELRKMIKKTSKNLGAYKQQTLGIQRNLIAMADRYGEVAVDVLSRKKMNVNICDYEECV